DGGVGCVGGGGATGVGPASTAGGGRLRRQQSGAMGAPLPSALSPRGRDVHDLALRLRGKRERSAVLKRARARVLHVLERSRNDDAVVVAAVARPDADQLVGLRVDEGDPAR